MRLMLESLKKVLTPPSLETFKTATFYLTVHSLALILVGILAMQVGKDQNKKLNRAGK